MGDAASPVLNTNFIVTLEAGVIFCLALGAGPAQSADAKFTEVNATCILSEDCTLPCNSEDQIKNVLWHFGRNEVPIAVYPKDMHSYQHHDFKNRASLSEEHISEGNAPLLLRRVQIQDEGTYRCELALLTSRAALINMKVHAPVVEVELQQEGDELRCIAKDVFPKPVLTWTPSTQHNTTGPYQTESGLYNISSSVRRSELSAEEYICNVSTPYSCNTATFKQASCVLSVDCTLPCYSEGQTEKVLWLFEKQQIAFYPRNMNLSQHHDFKNRTSLSEEHISEGNASLLLREVQIQHQGTYMCSVTSGRSIRNTLIHLTVTQSNWWIPLVASVVLALIVVVGVILWCCCNKLKKDNNSQRNQRTAEEVELTEQNGRPTESHSVNQKTTGARTSDENFEEKSPLKPHQDLNGLHNGDMCQESGV